jgi:hypothetical protein
MNQKYPEERAVLLSFPRVFPLNGALVGPKANQKKNPNCSKIEVQYEQ